MIIIFSVNSSSQPKKASCFGKVPTLQSTHCMCAKEASGNVLLGLRFKQRMTTGSILAYCCLDGVTFFCYKHAPSIPGKTISLMPSSSKPTRIFAWQGSFSAYACATIRLCARANILRNCLSSLLYFVYLARHIGATVRGHYWQLFVFREREH